MNEVNKDFLDLMLDKTYNITQKEIDSNPELSKKILCIKFIQEILEKSSSHNLFWKKQTKGFFNKIPSGVLQLSNYFKKNLVLDIYSEQATKTITTDLKKIIDDRFKSDSKNRSESTQALYSAIYLLDTSPAKSLELIKKIHNKIYSDQDQAKIKPKSVGIHNKICYSLYQKYSKLTGKFNYERNAGKSSKKLDSSKPNSGPDSDRSYPEPRKSFSIN